jgi:predicted Zn-dependent peptidase
VCFETTEIHFSFTLPEADKAAASMDVNVGSNCDPEYLQGLAHFLGFSFLCLDL